MSNTGLRTSAGPASPPFTIGPYTWDQALSFGANTAATAVSTSTADTKQFGVYLNSSATSGDARATYSRLWISGAGGSGEALRAYTTINNVTGATAHGAHVSLSFGTSGKLTGLGVAIRGTLQLPDAAVTGTLSALQAEIWGDGTSSSVAGTTTSFIRCIVDGATTNVKATVDTSGYLMSIQGLSMASTKLFQANTQSASHALRILIGATPYYILLSNTGA